MNTFYTILSAVIRPEIDEKLSLGLMLINDRNVSFYVSEKKLSVVKKLVSNNYFKGIKQSIKFIESSFIKTQNNIKETTIYFESNNTDKLDVFNYKYIDYLSDYNNNVLSFSKPIPIKLDYSESLFKKLFYKYIDEYSFLDIETKPLSQIKKFKNSFYPKVEKYFNIEQEINSLNYKGLIMPIKLDLMGKNEIEVFANTIDMSKNKQIIELGLADLLHISRAIPKAKQFIISSEPNKSNEINHRIWKNIRDVKEFEYVDISESEKIKEYAVKHGVVPLI